MITDLIIRTDDFISHVFYELRTSYLIQIFLGFSFLGKAAVVSSVALLVVVIALWKKKQKYILPLLLTVAGTGLTVYLTKLLIHRVRPSGDIAYYLEETFSFPSGHSAVAVALYGYITYLLLKETVGRKLRTNILFTGIFLVFLIGLSRLYLGVHFLSDVLGGYLIGLIWLIIGIWLTENSSTLSKSTK